MNSQEVAFTAVFEMQKNDEQVNEPSKSQELYEADGFQFDIAKATVHEEDATSLPAAGDKMFGCCEQFRKGSFIIVPEANNDSSHWIELWDVAMMGLIFCTAYCVPIQIAFYNLNQSNAFPIFNHISDVMFVLDMILQFFTAIPVHYGLDGHNTGLWITDPVVVWSKYLRGFFLLDLASTLPGLYEAFVWLQLCDNKRDLTFMRFSRLCRMIRLVRMVRLIQRWHATIGFPFFCIELAKFIFLTTIACHWFACIWVLLLQEELQGPRGVSTWLAALVKAKGDPCTPNFEEDPTCVYLLALYWSTMTITTVGYGDITAQSKLEYMTCTSLMLVSGYFWAYVVGSVCSILQSTDPYGVAFKQRLDELNLMMKSRSLPHALQVKLRRYMHEAKHIDHLRGHADLLGSTMSSALQREVAQHSSMAPLLTNVYWTADLEHDAQLELVKAMKPAFFGTKEVVVIPESLCIVRRGVMGLNGLILSHGDVWGHESILLETKALSHRCCPQTLTYVDLLYITKEDINNLSVLFPRAGITLRRAQVRIAVRRGLLYVAHMMKQGKSLEEAINTFTDPDLLDGKTRFHAPEPNSKCLRKPAAHNGMTNSTSCKPEDTKVCALCRNLRSEIIADSRHMFVSMSNHLAGKEELKELQKQVSRLEQAVITMTHGAGSTKQQL